MQTRFREFKDYYKILGVPENSQDPEIKKAYRQMVRNYHPDRVSHLGEEHAQEAHLRVLEIMEAYQELEKIREL